MQYQASVLLTRGTPVMRLPEKYSEVIREALYMTMPDGTMDVMLMKTPSTLRQLEQIVGKLYEMARHEAFHVGRERVRVTVLLDGRDIDTARNQAWEVVFAGVHEMELTNDLRKLVPPENPFISGLPVMLIKMSDEFLDVLESAAASGAQTPIPEEAEEQEDISKYGHNVVALGGTFDHLHDGHKILLTIAGYLSWEKVVVGITGPELLKNKRYAEAMQSYEKRKEIVEGFLNYVYPLLQVHCEMINDVYGPTAYMPEIDALVLSKETRSGGPAINKLRLEKGFNELKIYEIDLVGCKDGNESNNWCDKLSSTELRRQELEHLRNEQQPLAPSEM